MPAGRFYVEGVALTPGAVLDLPPDLAHQARDVLRLRTGDEVRLLDGAGYEYPAALLTVDRGRVAVRLGEREWGRREPAARVVLYQGMLKAAKYETILQKGTELGVAAFVPLITERSVAATEASSASRQQRWAKIVAEAIEQCGGTRLPDLRAPCALDQALMHLPANATALIPWEEERATSLRAAIATCRTDGDHPAVHLYIGPEGGFSAAEVALARRHGVVPVTLGPRILRAETAAIVTVTLTLDALGALERGPD